MLLHSGRRARVILDTGGDLFKRVHAMLLAPGEELRDGFGVGVAGVPVPDRRREEFDKPPTSSISVVPQSRAWEAGEFLESDWRSSGVPV
jgi:hypothetical protein